MNLTPKQKKFVSEYLIDLNATQAAMRAGYSEKTANEQGARLLAHVSVKEAIAKALAQREARTLITQDSVLADLREVADICMGRKPVKFAVVVKNTREGTAEPVEVTGTVFEPKDANKALELLGKHLGLFNDNVTMTVTTVKTLSDFYGAETDT